MAPQAAAVSPKQHRAASELPTSSRLTTAFPSNPFLFPPRRKSHQAPCPPPATPSACRPAASRAPPSPHPAPRRTSAASSIRLPRASGKRKSATRYTTQSRRMPRYGGPCAHADPPPPPPPPPRLVPLSPVHSCPRMVVLTPNHRPPRPDGCRRSRCKISRRTPPLCCVRWSTRAWTRSTARS